MEWTSYNKSLLHHILSILGIGIALLVATLQLYIISRFRVSFTESKTRVTFVCEIILNAFILVHFAFAPAVPVTRSVDLLNILGVLRIAFTPNNLIDSCYEICLEVVPIQLILLLVYNFDLKTS